MNSARKAAVSKIAAGRGAHEHDSPCSNESREDDYWEENGLNITLSSVEPLQSSSKGTRNSAFSFFLPKMKRKEYLDVTKNCWVDRKSTTQTKTGSIGTTRGVSSENESGTITNKCKIMIIDQANEVCKTEVPAHKRDQMNLSTMPAAVDQDAPKGRNSKRKRPCKCILQSLTHRNN